MTDAMDEAAAQAHLDVVRFLHLNHSEGCTRAALDWAVRRQHVDVVDFLCRSRREGCSAGSLTFAATYQDTAILTLLCQHTTYGCLLEARQAAERMGNRQEAIALLDEFIAHNVASCSCAQHLAQTAQRRRCCQWVKQEPRSGDVATLSGE